MILKLKRTPGIYLVGFMGSGKSTIGAALADELGWNFVDLDEEIEKIEDKTISQIFDDRGEATFREIESALLREQIRKVERGCPHVISLGGGAFTSQDNFNLVSNNGVTVWLDCPLETVERRIAGHTHRPLARDLDRMRDLFQTRLPIYSRADYRVSIHCDDARVAVTEILALPLF
jgi:shikimate kinase